LVLLTTPLFWIRQEGIVYELKREISFKADGKQGRSNQVALKYLYGKINVKIKIIWRIF